MKITRDVVTDLLPTYFANEASADTRALIEEFFHQDPEFARLAKEKSDSELLGARVQTHVLDDKELETLIRTRASVRVRSLWMAFAIVFSLFPLNCTFSSKGLTWIMIRDAPAAAETCIIAAAVCWIMYFRIRHKLRSSGI